MKMYRAKINLLFKKNIFVDKFKLIATNTNVLWQSKTGQTLQFSKMNFSFCKLKVEEIPKKKSQNSCLTYPHLNNYHV